MPAGSRTICSRVSLSRVLRKSDNETDGARGTFVTLIWLVVRGFKRGAWWGLGVLFLSPFTATVFGIVYWDEEKKPFLSHITSFVMALTLELTVILSWGGWGVLTASKRVHHGIMEQNLTEKDALKFMRANLNFLENTNQSEADRQKLTLMRDMVNKMEGGVTEEEHHRTNEDALNIMQQFDLIDEQHRQLEEFRKQVEESRPAASVSTSPIVQPSSTSTAEPVTPTAASADPVANQVKVDNQKVTDPREIVRRHGQAASHREEYQPIDLTQAWRYINAPVIVTRMDGAEQHATLIGIVGRKLRFEQRMPGGIVSFEYNDFNIKSLQIVRDVR
jgi:hypothetical protein